MISSEVQRTLVKSPPELWAELSDASSLARHLGELGEIRITRVEAEKLVEWESQTASGSVAIKASGWGTRVTLTAKRELPEPETGTPEDAQDPQAPEATEEPQASHAPEAAASSQAPETAATPEAAAQPAPAESPESAPEEAPPLLTAAVRFADAEPATLLGSGLERAAELEPEPAEGPADAEAAELPEDALEALPSPEPPAAEPRRGFFARLFGRGRKKQAATVLPTMEQPGAQTAPEECAIPQLDANPAAVEGAADPDPRPETPEPAAEAEPLELSALAEQQLSEAEQPPPEAEPANSEAEPVLEAEPAVAGEGDIAAELKSAEEAAAEEVTAILTGVLDRLGAAHHRPFSRA